MKKLINLIAVLMIGLGTFNAQIKQERKVESFHQVSVSSAIEVILTLGDNESVTFEADEKVISQLMAEVNGGELNLFVKGSVHNSGTMRAYVTAKKIDALSVKGAAVIDVKNTLTTEKMKIEAGGAGKIMMELNAGEVNAMIEGAALVKLKGSAKNLMANVSGAGSLKAEDLKSVNVDVTASGAGYAKVNAIDKLNANASSAGSIIYIGDPKDKNNKVSSSGCIKKS